MMDKKQLDSILFGGSSSTPTKTSSKTGKMDKAQLDDILFSEAGVSTAPPSTGFGAISAQDYASKTKEKLSWWEQAKKAGSDFKSGVMSQMPEPVQKVSAAFDEVGKFQRNMVRGGAVMATGVIRGIGRAAIGATKSTVANTIGYAQEALTGDDSIREAALAPVNIPFLGNVKGYTANPEDVENYGAANAKETAGDAAEAALDAVSLYSGGVLSSKTAKTFGGAIAKGAGVGGLFGWANGTAMAMQNDENLEDVIKNGLFSGVVGTVLGGVLGGATNLEKLKAGQASPETAASLTHRKDLLDEYKRISSDPERARRLNAAVEAGDMDTQQRVLGVRLYKQAEQLDDAAQKQWQKTELSILEKHADDLIGKTTTKTGSVNTLTVAGKMKALEELPVDPKKFLQLKEAIRLNPKKGDALIYTFLEENKGTIDIDDVLRSASTFSTGNTTAKTGNALTTVQKQAIRDFKGGFLSKETFVQRMEKVDDLIKHVHAIADSSKNSMTGSLGQRLDEALYLKTEKLIGKPGFGDARAAVVDGFLKENKLYGQVTERIIKNVTAPTAAIGSVASTGKSIIPSINYGIRETLSDEGVKVSTKGVLNFEGSKIQGMSNKGLQRDLQSLVDDMMAEPKSVADIVNRRAALSAAGSKFAKDPNAYRIYKGLTEAFDTSLDRRLSELGTDLGAMRADWKVNAGPAKKVLKALTTEFGEVDVDKAASYVRVAMSDARFNKAKAIADIDELAGTDFLKEIKMLGAIQVLDKAHAGENAPGVAAMIMSVGKRYADKLSAGVIGDATRPDVWKQVLIDKGVNPKLADTAARKATYDMLQLIGRQVISKVAGSLTND